MNWVDYTILGVICLSAIISLFRGFVSEAMSLIVWMVAFWVAFRYSNLLAAYFEQSISTHSVRLILSFIVLFVACLLIGGVINFLLAKLINSTGLAPTDRLLGLVFGSIRGGVLVLIVVMLAGLTPLPQDPWWKESTLLPGFQLTAVRVLEMFPDTLSNAIQFDPFQMLDQIEGQLSELNAVKLNQPSTD